MLISDWISDVCSSDLRGRRSEREGRAGARRAADRGAWDAGGVRPPQGYGRRAHRTDGNAATLIPLKQREEGRSNAWIRPYLERTARRRAGGDAQQARPAQRRADRTEEHNSELQTLMPNSFSVI